jgi:hypothetical protein
MKGEDLVCDSAELLREGALVGEPDPVGLLAPLPLVLLDTLGAMPLFAAAAGAALGILWGGGRPPWLWLFAAVPGSAGPAAMSASAQLLVARLAVAGLGLAWGTFSVKYDRPLQSSHTTAAADTAQHIQAQEPCRTSRSPSNTTESV